MQIFKLNFAAKLVPIQLLLKVEVAYKELSIPKKNKCAFALTNTKQITNSPVKRKKRKKKSKYSDFGGCI